MFDLQKIDNAEIGVLGDLALDIYWYADMKKSVLSRETPHYPLPVVQEKISLGAGGNVVANVAALAPKRLTVCGVCGDDWRGRLLREKLAEIGAETDGLIEEAGRFTQAYCKPMRMGISDVIYEDPRVDFSAVAAPSAETEAKILSWLDKIDDQLDILCVCDQFSCGTVTPRIRDRLSALKTPVIVDSRADIAFYRVHGILKPNEDECRLALEKLGEPIPVTPEASALLLSERTGADVLLTLGAQGSLFVSAARNECLSTPAVSVSGPIDICGAGDTTLSAFAACIASGASPAEAAEVSALASAVTIRKLAQTGTASRSEICTAKGLR